METTQNELNQLRQKFQLLEGDRKAYYEMSMTTMKDNKETIASLRAESKMLRKDLAVVQRQSRSDGPSDASCPEETIELEKNVSVLRKNYDALKSTVDGKKEQLSLLRDEAKSLQLESKKPNAEDSPLTRKIRLLENRLDKAMIKYNEAQSIRKTYDQIVRRLKEERIGFDNQLAGIEKTLQAKEHDFQELVLLCGDATHAKDSVIQELEHGRCRLLDDRKQREKEMKSKKEMVSVKNDIVNRMEKREQIRTDMIAKANGDLSTDEENQLRASVALNNLSQSKVADENSKQKNIIDVFEDAFKKIKEATGVSDVNEVIQKIVSQEDTQKNLKDLTFENQEKLEKLNQNKQKKSQKVDDIKYSGTSGGHRRKMVDDEEEKLAQASTKLERNRLRYERIAKILINVKAGIAHLTDKLESVQPDHHMMMMNDDTVVDILGGCETILVGLLNKISAESDIEMLMQMKSDFNEVEIIPTRPFNQRVALNIISDIIEDEGDDYDIGDLGLDDEIDEELTRDRIKKASNTIMLSFDKKTKKKVPKGSSTASFNNSSTSKRKKK